MCLQCCHCIFVKLASCFCIIHLWLCNFPLCNFCLMMLVWYLRSGCQITVVFDLMLSNIHLTCSFICTAVPIHHSATHLGSMDFHPTLRFETSPSHTGPYSFRFRQHVIHSHEPVISPLPLSPALEYNHCNVKWRDEKRSEEKVAAKRYASLLRLNLHFFSFFSLYLLFLPKIKSVCSNILELRS